MWYPTSASLFIFSFVFPLLLPAWDLKNSFKLMLHTQTRTHAHTHTLSNSIECDGIYVFALCSFWGRQIRWREGEGGILNDKLSAMRFPHYLFVSNDSIIWFKPLFLAIYKFSWWSLSIHPLLNGFLCARSTSTRHFVWKQTSMPPNYQTYLNAPHRHVHTHM